MDLKKPTIKRYTTYLLGLKAYSWERNDLTQIYLSYPPNVLDLPDLSYQFHNVWALSNPDSTIANGPGLY